MLIIKIFKCNNNIVGNKNNFLSRFLFLFVQSQIVRFYVFFKLIPT